MSKDASMITADGVRNKDIGPWHRDFVEKNVQIFCNLLTGADAVHAIINANTCDGIYVLNDGTPSQRDGRFVTAPGSMIVAGVPSPKHW